MSVAPPPRPENRETTVPTPAVVRCITSQSFPVPQAEPYRAEWSDIAGSNRAGPKKENPMKIRRTVAATMAAACVMASASGGIASADTKKATSQHCVINVATGESTCASTQKAAMTANAAMTASDAYPLVTIFEHAGYRGNSHCSRDRVHVPPLSQTPTTTCLSLPTMTSQESSLAAGQIRSHRFKRAACVTSGFTTGPTSAPAGDTPRSSTTVMLEMPGTTGQPHSKSADPGGTQTPPPWSRRHFYCCGGWGWGRQCPRSESGAISPRVEPWR